MKIKRSKLISTILLEHYGNELKHCQQMLNRFVANFNWLTLHSSDPALIFYRREKCILVTFLRGRRISEKLKQWAGGKVQGQVLKRGEEGRGWHFYYLIFTFWNYFTLYKLMLYIGRKIIFFCQHNFLKKVS